MDWFRSYHGAPTNPKWRVIARRAGVRAGDVAAVVWYLFDRASQQEGRGSIAGYDVEEIAVSFDYETQEVEKIIAALREKGVITPDDRLSTWEEHQPKREDGSAERAKAWREQKKQERTNANATERDRPLEKIREEKITPPKPPRGGLEPDRFDEFWREYPSRGAAPNPKKPAKERFAKLIERGNSAEDIIRGVRGYAAYCRRSGIWKTGKVSMATTFLGEERWEQYLTAEAERSRPGLAPMPSPAGG